jgi:hypothetical protein
VRISTRRYAPSSGTRSRRRPMCADGRTRSRRRTARPGSPSRMPRPCSSSRDPRTASRRSSGESLREAAPGLVSVKAVDGAATSFPDPPRRDVVVHRGLPRLGLESRPAQAVGPSCRPSPISSTSFPVNGGRRGDHHRRDPVSVTACQVRSVRRPRAAARRDSDV